MVASGKHWDNALIDMCWVWRVSPVASARFLLHFLATAPANKILMFGGDYIPVEPVVGHAAIARRGIGIAFSGLVRDGWLSLADAVELVEPIMRGNAARLFHVEAKGRALATAPWLG
jgi:predicted TIM-barrel fold metal-dependent hydrolase